MTNYAELDDDKLRRAIAERRGYQAKQWPGPCGKGFLLVDPSGDPVSLGVCTQPNVSEAWRVSEHALPDWPHDVNAALTLIEGMQYTLWSTATFYIGTNEITGERWIDKQSYEIILFSKEEYRQHHYNLNHHIPELFKSAIRADTIPHTICLAWLEWMDAKEKEGSK